MEFVNAEEEQQLTQPNFIREENQRRNRKWNCRMGVKWNYKKNPNWKFDELVISVFQLCLAEKCGRRSGPRVGLFGVSEVMLR